MTGGWLAGRLDLVMRQIAILHVSVSSPTERVFVCSIDELLKILAVRLGSLVDKELEPSDCVERKLGVVVGCRLMVVGTDLVDQPASAEGTLSIENFLRHRRRRGGILCSSECEERDILDCGVLVSERMVYKKKSKVHSRRLCVCVCVCVCLVCLV